MFRHLYAIALALGLLVAAPMQGAAQTLIVASDPAGIAQVITNHGYRAALEKTQSGNPIIRSAADGVNFDLFFYGCTDGADCRSIRFVAGFRMNPAPTVEQMNDWNKSKTIGMAYVADNGSARLGHFVALGGGVTDANFRAAFDLWRVALRQYADHIGFKR